MSYYDTLYISKSSTNEEIKSQYQKLTLDFHPDRRNGDNKLYLEIKEAYDILGNKYTRDFYNCFGNSGMKIFTDNTVKTLYSKVLSLVALRLLVLAVICLVCGIFILPIYLFLMKRNVIIDSFTLGYSLFMVSVFFLGLYVLKCFVLLRKYEEVEFKQFLLFAFAVFGKFLMFNLQVLFGFMIQDNLITRYKIIYIFPYFILEAIILIEDIIKIREDNEENGTKNKYLDVLIALIFRMIFFVAFCMDLNIKYKFLFPIAIVFLECQIRKANNLFAKAALFNIGLYCFCCYAALTNCIWMFLLFS
ncbi:hypothetical protein COBT_002363, partial [Conglomerata obtusa]